MVGARPLGDAGDLGERQGQAGACFGVWNLLAKLNLALAAGLSRAGLTPTRIHTNAKVRLEKVGEAFAITRIDLETEAQVPGIDDAAFQKSALDAKQKELVAASTEPLILTLLSRGESYGYALIQEVKRLSGEKIAWTDGMLYPVLHRMEREGWIASRWGTSETGRKRKYYSLKQDGKKALQAQRDQWVAVSGVFKQLWKEHYV